MKLQKAIELLNRIPVPLKTAEDHDTFTAIKLGIEALEAIQRHRHTLMPAQYIVLKGETKEEETKRR